MYNSHYTETHVPINFTSVWYTGNMTTDGNPTAYQKIDMVYS